MSARIRTAVVRGGAQIDRTGRDPRVLPVGSVGILRGRWCFAIRADDANDPQPTDAGFFDSEVDRLRVVREARAGLPPDAAEDAIPNEDAGARVAPARVSPSYWTDLKVLAGGSFGADEPVTIDCLDRYRVLDD